MLLSNITFLLLALAASVNCTPKRVPPLEWPDKYSFEITKYNIASGLTEDIKIWHTDKKSRLEYNHGAVKSFVVPGTRRGARGYHYEIHPETHNEDDVNEMVCHRIRRSKWDSDPEDILPATDDFKSVGVEMMKGESCTKFYQEQTESNIFSKHSLWAYFDGHAWIPVRYELEQYNSYLGNTDRHDLWEFESFDAKFNEKEVFDVSKICNQRDPIHHEIHDEAVTKQLLFIDPENDRHVDHVFKAFKKNFEKKYAHEDEHEMRRNIFKRSLRLIKETNRKNLGYKLTVNQFADRTPEEMKRHTGLLRRPAGKVGAPFPYTEEKVKEAKTSLPLEYDLRLEGIISPVQNQETCGSCWTFGTTAAVEGALARQNGGDLIRLSNQALVDCAWEFHAAGCDGGSDNAAYEWMIKYGLPTIADYGTYQNQDGFCHIQNVTRTYPIKAYVDVTPNSVDSLKIALVNHGPLSVSVHVTTAFSLYSGGVFYDFECDPMQLNHEITLVGYGEQYGETFWIVKNSWGPDWGIDGFMHIAAKDNNCGIMTEPTYVLF